MSKKDLLWQERYWQAKLRGHDQNSAAKIADECVERRDRIARKKAQDELSAAHQPEEGK